MLKKKTKLMIISDVHGNKENLNSAISKASNLNLDYKIFAGDWMLDENLLTQTFDYYVPGNNDFMLNNLPKTIIFKINEIPILLTHGDLFTKWTGKIDYDSLVLLAKNNNCKIVIFGHTHIKLNQYIEGILFFNSGSITSPRDSSDKTFGIIEFSDLDFNAYHMKIN